MKEKKNIILCIALLMVIALSMVLFFGIGESEKTGVQISSFVFIMITELTVFTNAMLMTNKRLNTFAIAGLSSTTFLYVICSFLFNVLLKGIFTTVKEILVLNFSLLLVYLFIDTIIIFFKKER